MLSVTLEMVRMELPGQLVYWALPAQLAAAEGSAEIYMPGLLRRRIQE